MEERTDSCADAGLYFLTWIVISQCSLCNNLAKHYTFCSFLHVTSLYKWLRYTLKNPTCHPPFILCYTVPISSLMWNFFNPSPNIGTFFTWIYRSCPGNSSGKESACNDGDPGLISGSGRSTEEWIGYPLH